MNTIAFCRNEVQVLPQDITRELLIAEMVILEKHLKATNEQLEKDLYATLVMQLAGIYWQINHVNVRYSQIIKSRV